MHSGKYASWEMEILKKMAAKAEKEQCAPIEIKKTGASICRRKVRYLIVQSSLVLLGLLAAGLVAYVFSL